MADCHLGYIKLFLKKTPGLTHLPPKVLFTYLFIFVVLEEPLWWAHHNSFEALDTAKRTPEMLPFGFQFIVDMHKSSTFDKAYRIKVWCYWENKLGTHWEQKTKKKKNLSHKPKRKNLGPLECMWSLLISRMNITVRRLSLSIFNLS